MGKATPALKCHLPQPPNLTDPMEVLETPVESLQNGDEELTDVNNVEVSEKLMVGIIDALRGNETDADQALGGQHQPQ